MKKITPSRWSEIFLCALFSLLPLALHDGYFDITETKTAVFATLSAVYLLSLPFFALREKKAAALPSKGKAKAKAAAIPAEKRPLPGGAILFLIFAGTELCSSLLFGGRAALMAPHNRYQGVFTFLLYAGMGATLSRWGEFTPRVRRFAVGTMVLVSLFAALNAWGVDALGTLASLRPADRSRYLSTIGNVNFLGAYTAMLLPLCMALFCTTEKKRLPLPAAGCVLGTAALLTGSDSGLLGVGVAVLLLPWLLRKNPSALRRIPVLAALTTLSARLFALFMGDGGIGLSALGAALSGWAVTGAVCLLSAALYPLLRRMPDERLRRVGAWYGVFPAAALLSGAVFLLLANTLLRDSLPGWIARYAVIDADWGTDRGAIWAHCLTLFRRQGITKKLIGGGAGCLARYDALHRLFSDAVLDSAHNEYLHYLLTGGVVGLAAWLGALFCAFRRASAGRTEDAVLLAAVIGGAAQSAVNIAQCTTTPLMIALLALLWRENGALREEKT